MNIKPEHIEEFCRVVEQDGYRGYPVSSITHPHGWRLYYKLFKNEARKRLYQVCLAVYAPYSDKDDYGVSFEMLMNGENGVNCDRVDFSMMREGMDVRAFEKVAATIYEALRSTYPKPYSEE